MRSLSKDWQYGFLESCRLLRLLPTAGQHDILGCHESFIQDYKGMVSQDVINPLSKAGKHVCFHNI
jgi:hypothetical protein